MGVTPLKFQGEMPAVGSTSHHRIRVIVLCLKDLMRLRGLRSVNNSYGTRETTLSLVEIKRTCEIYFSNIKTPFFSLDRKGNRSFEGLLWGRKPKYILGLRSYSMRHNGPRIDQ